MNWILDRVLVLGVVATVAGALNFLATVGVPQAGAVCGVAAIAAAFVTMLVRR